jgi:lysophospholipase L1-like esterase
MVNTILLLGSSTIEKWKHFSFHIKNEYVINKGISGLTTSSLLSNNYFDYITNGITRKPKYIVFYCGINDVFDNAYNNKTMNKTIIKNIRIFLQELHKIFPTTRIIVISLIKSPKTYNANKIEDINYINNRLRDFCSIKTPYLHYINVNKELQSSTIDYFMNDGFHLNEQGYEKINKKILQSLHT